MNFESLSLVLSALLFAVGAAGVLLRRNAIIMFMCVELMLNAVNLTLVAFSRTLGIEAQILVFFVMAVAAAEAAVNQRSLPGGMGGDPDRQSAALPEAAGRAPAAAPGLYQDIYRREDL